MVTHEALPTVCLDNRGHTKTRMVTGHLYEGTMVWGTHLEGLAWATVRLSLLPPLLSVSVTHKQSHTRYQGTGDLPEPQQDPWQDALSSGLLCSPGNFKT